MGPPKRTPIGLQLAATAKQVSRAFDDALATSGGSRPEWLILLALKTRDVASQRELADAVGIRGATLTHHLHAMESSGLVTRTRDPENRRVQFVALTKAGEDAFLRLRGAAMAHDKRLCHGFTEPELEAFHAALRRLSDNVARGA
jgi:MarR family transcriptional regulator for hemolysin